MSRRLQKAAAQEARRDAVDRATAANYKVMTFGKHKGKPMMAVPSDYLRWLLSGENTWRWLALACRAELDRREEQRRMEPAVYVDEANGEMVPVATDQDEEFGAPASYEAYRASIEEWEAKLKARYLPKNGGTMEEWRVARDCIETLKRPLLLHDFDDPDYR